MNKITDKCNIDQLIINEVGENDHLKGFGLQVPFTWQQKGLKKQSILPYYLGEWAQHNRCRPSLCRGRRDGYKDKEE